MGASRQRPRRRDDEQYADFVDVAFNSGASNLVPGDTNGAADVFVHDRQTGITSRVRLRSTHAMSFEAVFSGWTQCLTICGSDLWAHDFRCEPWARWS